MVTKNPQKIPKYFCEYCDIKTNNKKDYEKHVLTAKHKKTLECNKNVTKNPQISPNCIIRHFCKICNKEYTSRVGLWRHNKNCISNSVDEQSIVIHQEPTTPELISLITELVKSHNGLQDSILEICKNGTNNTTNSHNNSNNKSFNLQFFLNET
jgi:hypothetical protein